MSKQLESKTCAFCHGILFEEDDVVVCPECGAPYHRACFEQNGRCVLEQFHGTEKQYDKLHSKKDEVGEKTKTEQPKSSESICSVCGKSSSSEHEFCPFCGSVKASKQNGFAPYTSIRFNTFGGFDKKAKIEEDVTAEEAAAFVGMKAYRYVPRFIENKKISWNWAAFLVPQAWFAYRKMYSYLAVTVMVFLLALVCMVPFYSELYAAISQLPIANSSAEQSKLVQQATVMAIQNADASKLLMFMAGSLLNLVTMLLSGLFGERAYRSRTVTEIRKIKADEPLDEPALLIARKGGVNLILCLLALALVSNSDIIIEFLISLF